MEAHTVAHKDEFPIDAGVPPLRRGVTVLIVRDWPGCTTTEAGKVTLRLETAQRPGEFDARPQELRTGCGAAGLREP